MLGYVVQENPEKHVFRKGDEVLKGNGFAVVGMSPGNSYFTEETINELLKFTTDNFSKTKIMIVDKPAEHSYRAIGYDEVKAKRKARLKGNNLRNKSNRSIDSILGDNPEVDVEIVDWDDVYSNSEYQDSYAKIIDLYENNDSFREDARGTTKEVLEGRTKEGVELERAVDEGVKYLLEEFAFLDSSCKMFDEKEMAYVYHHNWPVYENFANGVYDNKAKEHLGMIIAEKD